MMNNKKDIQLGICAALFLRYAFYKHGTMCGKSEQNRDEIAILHF